MMKKLLAISALVFSAAPTLAAQSGGGGGGGGGLPNCQKCKCIISGTMGGQWCSCQSSFFGAAACTITFLSYSEGSRCDVQYGACAPVVVGFAP